MAPCVLTLTAAAGPLMKLWLGASLAPQSVIVAQIVCVGMFFNAMAYAPLTYIQAVNRPDITARVHLIELPVTVLLLWLSVTFFGLIGVAMASMAFMPLTAL